MATTEEIMSILGVIDSVLFVSIPLINLIIIILSFGISKLRKSDIPIILFIIHLVSYVPVVVSIIFPDQSSAIPFISALAWPVLFLFYTPVFLFNSFLTLFFWRRRKN